MNISVRIAFYGLLFFSGALLACKNEVTPTVITSEITNITETSATCGGSITNEGSGTVVARGVCWSTNTTPTTNDSKTSDGTGSGSFVSNLTGLNSSQHYFVRAYATNSAGTAYGDEKSIPAVSPGGQIIADHTIVADFDKIPAYYMSEVKKMLISFPGKSHSIAYRNGLELLEALYPSYAVNVAYEESPASSYLRCNEIDFDLDEDKWYTWKAYDPGNEPGVADTIKHMIKRNYDHGHPLSVIGFAWCWDMMSSYESQLRDPVYGCIWAGTSYGGPDSGIHGWGLDAGDYSITGNRVSMDTYLGATEDYIAYCKSNNYPTKVIFTTGPVDWLYVDEAGYQAHIKHEYIRNYVKADPTRILFDYADILVHDDDGGTPNTSGYNGNVYPVITTTNLGDENTGHIGAAGAIRLAKAEWWMLARIAGWDGITSAVPKTGISVTGAGGSSVITAKMVHGN